MKQITNGPWKAFLFSSLLTMFVSFSAHASGAKMPTITDSGTSVVATPAPAESGGTPPLETPTVSNPIPAANPPASTDVVSTSPPPIVGGVVFNPPKSPDLSPLLTFNIPWTKSETSIVIDAYEGNSIDWNKMSADKKVAAVIHRSSIGTQVDSQYFARRKLALEHGYLWGAYHLGKKGNTIAQANFFLSLVQNDPNTVMFLDLENTSSGSFMTTDEAIVFMDYIHQKTGRILSVYANDSTTKELNQKVKKNPLFLQSKLWYARFKSKVTDFPVGIWPNYFLWQFSSEINCSKTGACLYNVPGTKNDMDINVFYGSGRELAAKWNND